MVTYRQRPSQDGLSNKLKDIKATKNRRINFAPWQKPPSPQQKKFLDLEEIAKLNREMGANEPPEETKESFGPGRVFAVLAVFCLAIAILITGFVWYMGDIAWPDIEFFQKSHQLLKEDLVQMAKPAVVSIKSVSTSGSGFNIKSEGVVVTNLHVLEDAALIEVTFPDGQNFLCSEWESYPEVDLAVIYLAGGADLPVLEIAEELPKKGDTLLYIGNPLGFNWQAGEATLNGMVKAEGMKDEVYLITSTAGDIYPGTSGSPVFNAQGQVAGVLFAHLSTDASVGLVIPIELLFQVQKTEQ